MKRIESIQNPYIKSLVQLLEKARIRKRTGTFLIEGRRELELALKGGYTFESLLFCPDLISSDQMSTFTALFKEQIEISKEVYQKLAYRETTEGLLAVAHSKDHLLQDLTLSENPLLLIAEAPEKPGNTGALLRTADAAGLDAVIIANPQSDLYNPNIIRSSVGCVFTNQIAMGTTDEVIAYLNKQQIDFYSATLQDSTVYHSLDYNRPTAFVVGTEATGLSSAWRTNSTKNIIIPMSGQIDSMNVSVAAAVLVFEAKRQRNFKMN